MLRRLWRNQKCSRSLGELPMPRNPTLLGYILKDASHQPKYEICCLHSSVLVHAYSQPLVLHVSNPRSYKPDLTRLRRSALAPKLKTGQLCSLVGLYVKLSLVCVLCICDTSITISHMPCGMKSAKVNPCIFFVAALIWWWRQTKWFVCYEWDPSLRWLEILVTKQCSLLNLQQIKTKVQNSIMVLFHDTA